jgi:hypothetical protein
MIKFDVLDRLHTHPMDDWSAIFHQFTKLGEVRKFFQKFEILCKEENQSETLWQNLLLFLEQIKSTLLIIFFVERSGNLVFQAWNSPYLKSSPGIFRIIESHVLKKSCSSFYFIFKNQDQVEIWNKLAEKYGQNENVSNLLQIKFSKNFIGNRHLGSRKASDLVIHHLRRHRKLEVHVYDIFPNLHPTDQDRILEAMFDIEFDVLFGGNFGSVTLIEHLKIRMPPFSVIMSSTLLKGSEKLLEFIFQHRKAFTEKQYILRNWQTYFPTSDLFVKCLNSFQSVFRAESLIFLDEFSAYLKHKIKNNEKLSNQAVQVFLRYWLITDEVSDEPEILQYIFEKSLLDALIVCPSSSKDSPGSDFSFFEIQKIIMKSQHLRPNLNLSWMYALSQRMKIDTISDNYLKFLESRVIGLHIYSYLSPYFEYTRQLYPERVEDLQKSMTGMLVTLKTSGKKYYYPSQQELEFYVIIFSGDFQNPILQKILSDPFNIKFYSTLAVVWDELPNCLKSIVQVNLIAEKVDLNNFHHFVDIVCKNCLYLTSLFAEVFSFVRCPQVAKKFITKEVRNFKIKLGYRVQMASNFFFVYDFQPETDLYGISFFIELCLSCST